MTNLAEKSLSELALLYNTMVPKEHHIKKFRDKTTAILRIEKLTEPTQGKWFTSAELSSGEHLKQKGQKPTPFKPVTIQRREKRMSKDQKTIHVLAESNPRRAGTSGWLNFNLYKEGMTIEDFKKAGGKSNHMAWDLEHKYIELK